MFLTQALGNNATDFVERKNLGSDTILRISPLTVWSYTDVRLTWPFWDHEAWNQKAHKSDEMLICYEYCDYQRRLNSANGLQSLIWDQTTLGKPVFIIDNHNHALAMRYRAYEQNPTLRGSRLIHIDQHSDMVESTISILERCRNQGYTWTIQNIPWIFIDHYTNEVATIASFIKPTVERGLCSEVSLILSEYKLLHENHINSINDTSIILDIDLDFRAPEMSIQAYKETIHRVRKLLLNPKVQCITIATSPTYIDQTLALQILDDLLQPNAT